MGRLVHLRGNPHDETQALLPWYVTGQLDQPDRRLVDGHLATCALCREDLAFERRLGSTIRDLPLDTTQQWEGMAAKLPQQAERRFWLTQPVRISWFLGAQAAVILLVFGLVTSQRTAVPAPAYHVLGDAPAPQTGNILVMFAPGAPEQAVRESLAATHAQLVNGPTAAGAYLLAVAPANRGKALATLRARRDIVLAQPIDAPKP